MSRKTSAFHINSLFSIALFLSLILSFNACKEKEDDLVEQAPLVESIDIKEMAKIHLKDYSLLRERSYYGVDTQYVYTNNNNEAIYIVLGIYPSQAAADSSLINQYFSYMAGVPIKGSYQGIEIGDGFWWLTGAIKVSNVYFIRRNAMFMMNSSKYEGLVDLAKKIDDDILNKASYITYRE